MHQAYQKPQGKIRLWLDIYSEDEYKNKKDFNITPPPVQELEVRVCVFGTQKVKMMDIEGTSDVFFRAHIDENDKQETDTHYRCMDGNASFNYRLILPVKMTQGANTKLTLECFDRDFIKFSDHIGKVVIDLKDIISDCNNTKKMQELTKDLYETYLTKKSTQTDIWSKLKLKFVDKRHFWVDFHPEGQRSKAMTGKVKLQIQVFPKDLASKQPAGKGRNEPNADPYLPAPEGRIEFSMNPRKMLG